MFDYRVFTPLQLSIPSFLWSPSWFKDKEKKSRRDFSSLRDFYLLSLGYSALYLADVAVY